MRRCVYHYIEQQERGRDIFRVTLLLLIASPLSIALLLVVLILVGFVFRSVLQRCTRTCKRTTCKYKAKQINNLIVANLNIHRQWRRLAVRALICLQHSWYTSWRPPSGRQLGKPRTGTCQTNTRSSALDTSLQQKQTRSTREDTAACDNH